METGLNGLFLGAFLGLFLFGLGFNWLTGWLHQRGDNEGYTWLLVVVGVGVTLFVGGFVVGWEAVGVLFLLFAASGSPMAGGDVHRYLQARRAEAQALSAGVSADDDTEEMAE